MIVNLNRYNVEVLFLFANEINYEKKCFVSFLLLDIITNKYLCFVDCTQ